MKKKIDYEKLEEITVKSQKELDDIPLDFKGRIYIEFGTYWDRAIVKNKYYQRVVARENSSVEAWGNSSVEAWGNSSVEAWENSSVEAWENSSVEARENSSVVGSGNVQVVDCSDKYYKPRIKISGNARIVYNPKNINEFLDFYDIKHTKTKAVFYKAVRKQADRFFSNYDENFEYKIGKTKKENCDPDIDDMCSSGIHIAHLNWALNFGSDFLDDMTIIEVETKIKDIVVPINTDGKVRTSEVKVLREVPLSECGLYGQMLEKRRNKCQD